LNLIIFFLTQGKNAFSEIRAAGAPHNAWGSGFTLKVTTKIFARFKLPNVAGVNNYGLLL
jgi:hypothetical protein